MINAIIRTIIKDLFAGFIQSFIFATLVSTLIVNSSSIKGRLKGVFYSLKEQKKRIDFYFYFYAYLIYDITVFSRPCIYSPFSNILGGWKLEMTQFNGLTFDVFGNIGIFIPLIILLNLHIRNNLKISKRLLFSSCAALCCSATIEILQIVFRKGTFQLADLLFNTVGGFVGGLIYLLVDIIIKKGRERNGN